MTDAAYIFVTGAVTVSAFDLGCNVPAVKGDVDLRIMQ